MNKQVITKNNLASVMLLYNYLANNNFKVDIDIINDIYDNFIFQFKDKYFFIDDNYSESQFNDKNIIIPIALKHHYYKKNIFKANLLESDYLGISILDKYYYIKDIESLIINYYLLSEEIINYSLNDENLQVLNVSKDKLKINHKSKQYTSHLDLSSLNRNSLVDIAKEKLQEKGYTNINISHISSVGKYSNHLFRVYYNANCILKQVDVKKMIYQR